MFTTMKLRGPSSGRSSATSTASTPLEATTEPVISSSTLPKDKVVGSEDLSEGPRPNTVHGAGLQVHEDSSGHILAPRGLVVVNIDPLELKITSSVVASSGVDAMLIADDLPELGPDLVSALAGLEV